MFQALQWVGGICYFLQKVFLSIAERAKSGKRTAIERHLHIAAWTVYLVGLPPWIIVFLSRRDWIAAAVEASGAPSMVLGLIIARGGLKAKPGWLDRTAWICIPLGFTYSLCDIGLMTASTQWLEAGLALGFLVGTYQLANQNKQGYLWYVLMHISCGWLMLIQDVAGLAAQQALSLVFIVDAYCMARRNKISFNR